MALPEIARVLRPGGRLALVWNTRDDREPWVARLSAIIGNEAVRESDVSEPIAASGLFGPVEAAEFRFEQALDREVLLDLVLSRSYCAKLSPAEREPILEAVGELYDEIADSHGVQPAVRHRVLQDREARSDLELAADGLDVVAVGVEQERGVVAARLVRAVLLADTGRAVVSVSRLDTDSVERVNLLARVRDEGHVDGAARLLVARDHEVRELGAPIALPERRYREWLRGPSCRTRCLRSDRAL